MVQRVWPRELVAQHVTAPALPHVERAAQDTTCPRQSFDSPDWRATRPAQRTNSPWFAAVSQPQSASTAARAAATASSSPGASPQPARAGSGMPRSTSSVDAVQTSVRAMAIRSPP